MTQRKTKRRLDPTGIEKIDRLANLDRCTVEDYVAGASAYVRSSSEMLAGPKKAGQIRLSSALARALAAELVERVPYLQNRLSSVETTVSGALRTVKADVSESHQLDGLRLAIEIKPVNLAVGRAIWNRFGDIRTFAVNIHLKFPFAVVGGVLVVPTYEVFENSERRPTKSLIQRAIERLVRAGGRRTEAEAAHLLEGIAVLVYDPDSASVDPELPPVGSGLRWNEFVDRLVATYQTRFEETGNRT